VKSQIKMHTNVSLFLKGSLIRSRIFFFPSSKHIQPLLNIISIQPLINIIGFDVGEKTIRKRIRSSNTLSPDMLGKNSTFGQ